MEFGALGPLRVAAGGQVIEVGAGRQRAVLAVLMLRANQAVSIPQLIDGIWGQDPPASAHRLVHTYIWRVRELLGQAANGRPLTSVPGGYLLQARDNELDVTRFGCLVTGGRAAIANGDPAGGADMLRAALELWRGEPLEDVELHGDLGIERVRLARQRADTHQECIAADLECGRYHQVITEVEQLLVIDPMRESLIAQLMLALHRAGRRAEALETFRQARVRLADELGLDPSAELCRLHQRVLADDPALHAPLAGSPGCGPDPPRQLPAAVRHFAGRVAELSLLAGLVSQAGDVGGAVIISAIEGTAGVGKTALAVQFAHQAAPRFPGGQLYVDLRGFGPAGPPVAPGDAIRTFLHALAVPADRIPADLDGLVSAYRTAVSGRRMLVILDNARDCAQVRPLIPGSPSCLVIITSRNHLTGLAATQATNVLTLDLLTVAEAEELLIRRLGASRVRCEPDAAEELIRLCARLPLALSITAARVATRPNLTLAAATVELRDARTRLDALDTGDHAANIRAAFSWSYNSLSRPAARLFRLLGVMPATDLTAASAAALTGTEHGDAASALAGLTSACLLQEGQPGRYTAHDLLRCYARDRACAEDSEDQRGRAVAGLIRWYLGGADAAATYLFPQMTRLGLPRTAIQPLALPRFGSQHEALDWLDIERDNLVAAAVHAAASGPEPAAWLLADALRGYFWQRRHGPEWLVVAKAAVTAAQACGESRDRAAALLCHADAYSKAGPRDHAVAHYSAALEQASQAAWPDGQVAILSNLGGLMHGLGRAQQALDHYQHALEASARAVHPHLQATLHTNLGRARTDMAQYHPAKRHLLLALALYRGMGPTASPGNALNNLGIARHQLGEFDAALEDLGLALDRFTELGNVTYQIDAHVNLSALNCDWGRMTTARRHADRSYQLATDTANQEDQCKALAALAALHLRDHDWESAAGRSHQALSLASSTYQYQHIVALLGLAEALLGLGDTASARTHCDDALAMIRHTGFTRFEGEAQGLLAGILAAGGAPGPAIHHAVGALRIHGQTGHRYGQARAHLRLAQILPLTAASQASRHRERALRIFEELGMAGSMGRRNGAGC